MSWAEVQDWFGLEDLAEQTELEGIEQDYAEMYSLAINTPSKWITATGEVMQIKNMETSHIRNCIRLIEQGKIKCQAHKLTTLKAELQKRLR